MGGTRGQSGGLDGAKGKRGDALDNEHGEAGASEDTSKVVVVGDDVLAEGRQELGLACELRVVGRVSGLLLAEKGNEGKGVRC